MNTADGTLQAVAAYCGYPVETLLVASERSGHGRLLAAYFLSNLWGDIDDGRVQQRLNCPRETVLLARRLAMTEVSFQKDIHAIRGTKPPAAPATHQLDTRDKSAEASALQENLEALLFRIAQDWAGLSRAIMLEKKSSPGVAHARRVLIVLGKIGFGMSNEAIEKAFQCNHDTVQRLVLEATSDYEYGPLFRKEVQRVAEQFHISLGRKPMKRRA